MRNWLPCSLNTFPLLAWYNLLLFLHPLHLVRLSVTLPNANFISFQHGPFYLITFPLIFHFISDFTKNNLLQLELRCSVSQIYAWGRLGEAKGAVLAQNCCISVFVSQHRGVATNAALTNFVGPADRPDYGIQSTNQNHLLASQSRLSLRWSSWDQCRWCNASSTAL